MKFLNVIILPPRILEWLLEFWKISSPPLMAWYSFIKPAWKQCTCAGCVGTLSDGTSLRSVKLVMEWYLCFGASAGITLQFCAWKRNFTKDLHVTHAESSTLIYKNCSYGPMTHGYWLNDFPTVFFPLLRYIKCIVF